MKNNEKIEKLQSLCEQEEVAQKELKKEKQKVKIIQNRIKDLKRRERTHRLCTHGALLHRLCTHGALLEKFFPPEEFTDEMILFLLNGSFNRQNETVRKIMEDVKEIFSSGEESEIS